MRRDCIALQKIIIISDSSIAIQMTTHLFQKNRSSAWQHAYLQERVVRQFLITHHFPKVLPITVVPILCLHPPRKVPCIANPEEVL